MIPILDGVVLVEPLGDQGLDWRRQRGEKRSYDRGGGHDIDERGERGHTSSTGGEEAEGLGVGLETGKGGEGLRLCMCSLLYVQ